MLNALQNTIIHFHRHWKISSNLPEPCSYSSSNVIIYGYLSGCSAMGRIVQSEVKAGILGRDCLRDSLCWKTGHHAACWGLKESTACLSTQKRPRIMQRSKINALTSAFLRLVLYTGSILHSQTAQGGNELKGNLHSGQWKNTLPISSKKSEPDLTRLSLQKAESASPTQSSTSMVRNVLRVMPTTCTTFPLDPSVHCTQAREHLDVITPKWQQGKITL